MRVANEMRRAINRLNANAAVGSKIDAIQVEAYVLQATTDLECGNYDFSTYNSIVLNQGAKKRPVKLYKLFSTENILCQYIKQILDRQFKIKYPNRNKTVHSLFDYFKAVKQMSDFTIIKFDFKDYFNSVSASYVFEKYIKSKMSSRAESKLISTFSYQTKYSYAGLNTSNIFAEIIAIEFDQLIRQAFSQYGLLFFDRYIDDTIIILNQHLEQNVCDNILNNCLADIYYDANIVGPVQCKTQFNPSKFKMITRRKITPVPSSIDFLGYEFFFQIDAKKNLLQYGVTAEKQNKYNGRIDKIVEEYKHDNDMELLRHRILAFSSRTVYMTKKHNNSVWKAKGFINNYGELRFLIDTHLLHADTKIFLENMIEQAFTRNTLPLPYFLKGCNSQRGYNLLHNMRANKTLLLVDHVGYDRSGLEKLCSQVHITIGDKEYGSLVREYLIKTKVGY